MEDVWDLKAQKYDPFLKKSRDLDLEMIFQVQNVKVVVETWFFFLNDSLWKDKSPTWKPFFSQVNIFAARGHLMSKWAILVLGWIFKAVVGR